MLFDSWICYKISLRKKLGHVCTWSHFKPIHLSFLNLLLRWRLYISTINSEFKMMCKGWECNTVVQLSSLYQPVVQPPTHTKGSNIWSVNRPDKTVYLKEWYSEVTIISLTYSKFLLDNILLDFFMPNYKWVSTFLQRLSNYPLAQVSNFLTLERNINKCVGPHS